MSAFIDWCGTLKTPVTSLIRSAPVSAITQFDGRVFTAFEGQACGTSVPNWPNFPIPGPRLQIP